MSTAWLFGMGVLVTLVVAIGVGLPAYGIVLGARDRAERENGETAGVHELTKESRRREAA